jgi:hypothetical protein
VLLNWSLLASGKRDDPPLASPLPLPSIPAQTVLRPRKSPSSSPRPSPAASSSAKPTSAASASAAAVQPGGDWLPTPAPLTGLVGTPLLDDLQFVKALHEAGRAKRGEPGSSSDAQGRPPVIIGVGDSGFLPMLHNFIETSVKRHALRHYFVFALDKGMCGQVPSLDGAIVCHTWSEAGSLKGGNYGSPEFARLVNVKSEVVLASVLLGYDSLLVDGDIVFLRNPLPYLADVTANNDLLIQDDASGGLNSGFMLVKANPRGLAFIGESVSISRGDPKLRQQPAVNAAIKKLASQGRLRHHVLPTTTFPCGKDYFESPKRRMFPWENPCRDCYIMHNNWIVSTTAKVFRFKENLQWLVDSPDRYYSDSGRKYLQFGNPASNLSKDKEIAALKAAFILGRMLKRVVILPEFRCHRCSVAGDGGAKGGCSGGVDRCMFLANYGIRELEKAMGGTTFRETMFRYNPLTPTGVRLEFDWDRDGPEAMEAPSEPSYLIASSPPEGFDPERVRSPRDAGRPTEGEIQGWFGDIESSVLLFHSLYDLRPEFSSRNDADDFESQWAGAIKPKSLRQYD